MVKTCSQCGVEGDLIEGFHAKKSNRDGRERRCKECRRALARAWNKANPERVKENKARYYREHAEACKVAAVKWAKDHPEEMRARSIERYRRDPEKGKVKVAKRRAVKLAYEGPHYTVDDVKTLLDAQGGLCAYCGTVLDASRHVDHVVPLSRGGGNGPDNIALSCPRCNSSKGGKLLGYEWCACGAQGGNYR